ncbi:MAG: hypothetical protein ILO36_02325 [Abditibacteriota bacterium]|nr:hypothetical protein [Abditibacteriota bacterium]
MITNLVDVHAHTIPGVDDGSRNEQVSLEILKEEYSMGMRHQFCTPHMNDRSEMEAIPRMKQLLEHLKAACKADCPELNLYLGYELGPDFDILGAMKTEGEKLTMGDTDYILIGPLFSGQSNNMMDMFYDLQTAGYVPILAHPERMGYYQKDPSILQEYVEKGVLLQVNAPSLMGRYGDTTKHFCRELIDHNWVSFVASDNHRAHAESRMYKGYEYISRHWSSELADRLLIENGLKVINNRVIENEEPLGWHKTKKSFWQVLFKK